MSEQRAKPPSVPPLTASARRDLAAHDVRMRRQESQERVRVYRGLVMLAVLVLLLSMLHAGWGRVFVPGWWRQW